MIDKVHFMIDFETLALSHNAETDAIYQAEDLLVRADKYDINIDLINARV